MDFFNRIMEILESDEHIGICTQCNSEQPAEPDARDYECESCGDSTVYGAQELLIMGYI